MARLALLIALAAALVLWAVDTVLSHRRAPESTSQSVLAAEPTPLLSPSTWSPSSPTATPPPHFALDDLTLGRGFKLTRFIPNGIDISGNDAVEGKDRKLYIIYSPRLWPWQWSEPGGEPSRLGILDRQGHIHPIELVPDEDKLNDHWGRIELLGLYQGMPVVHVRDPGSERYYVVGPHSTSTLVQPPHPIDAVSQCIAFDGGQMCTRRPGGDWTVEIHLPGRDPLTVTGAVDEVDWIDRTTYVRHRDVRNGEVWLEGGGPDIFLLTEFHQLQGAAECLFGEVIKP